jgi:D-lactate dehydrogenase
VAQTLSNSSSHTSQPCSDILTELWQRYAFANDAGPYLLIPEAVMQPRTEGEIQSIFRSSRESRTPITFRAGGTSLSGQSITDGWLVDIGRHWRKIEPLDQGMRVRVQGGAIGGIVNATLRSLGRKIGPDPSSINSAMMGGILSNNSSGMCCGVVNNAYHTMESIRFVLPDGSVWDTSLQHEARRFESEKPNIARELSQLRAEILASPSLMAKIRRKYKQKNTVGYSLNAFVDHETPLEILAHLLIGGEGTLAFISEAVLKTLPELPEKATSLAFFHDAETACEIIPQLIDIQCDAVEFMDRASMESIRNLEGVPAELPDRLNEHKHLMGLLFEFQAADQESLAQKLQTFRAQCEPRAKSLGPIEFTQSKKQQANLWKLRKGMYPAVAAVRGKGEAAILEDVTFPLERLGAAIGELQSLFVKHAYSNGIIFGHARDGNLHFVISQPMATAQDTDKYARFIDDMVDLVVHRFDGALKAEHGTGRNMAPFVETEWGSEAVGIMRRLKRAIDPDGLLNPDVILTSKPKLHLDNIKDLPVVEDIVDKCVECGACEPRCPSRDFTLSPRQRIVLRRARERMLAAGKFELAKQLDREYEFAGKESCATDGLCALDCPVAINTGELIKQLRRSSVGNVDSAIASMLGNHFGLAERAVKLSLLAGRGAHSILGGKNMRRITKAGSVLFHGFPQWHDGLSEDHGKVDVSLLNDDENAEVIYWPTCMSRMMGGTADVLVRVAAKASMPVHIPKDAIGKCCGQAFSSKGYIKVAIQKQSELLDAIWEWSRHGERPVVMDLGSCTSFLKAGLPYLDAVRKERLARSVILDSVEFAAQLLPSLSITDKQTSVAVHSVCSNHKYGWETPLLKVASACAEKVYAPHEGKCCGMGGDRGFEIPELALSATRDVGENMAKSDCETGYTNARSCAISLSSSSKKPWRSIFHLLDRCTGWRT